MTIINRTITAPNGNTYEQYEAFVTDLQNVGRGAHGTFALMDPHGNDLDGITLDLLCVSDNGRYFHAYYSTATYDTEAEITHADWIYQGFWASSLEAAWIEHDNQNAAAEDS